MRETNMSGSDLDTPQALQTILGEIGLTFDDEACPVSGSMQILRSALTTLSDGRISETVAHVADRFRFNDHALRLEITEKTA